MNFDKFIISNKYWKKDYDDLSLIEKESINEYIHDLQFPIWKKVIIENDSICYISKTGTVLNENKKIIKEYENSSKYKTVWIRSKNNNQKCYPKLVHRLVAEAFVPNPENKPEVNHINGNTNLNWSGNLEWVTHCENIKASIEIGHHKIGIEHKNSKYTNEQIHEVCKMLEDDKNNIFEIVAKTGVSVKTIKNIRFNNGWAHISKNYDISKNKRNKGPKYSLISKKIIELINEGKSNNEIYFELNKLGIDSNISRKNISDRIYHIKHNII